MLITLEWLPERSVLLATYTSVIHHAEYHAMVQQRDELIRAHATPSMLVADMRAFEGLDGPTALP
jgi:hypothetical protein